jgi:hypothetical protein
VWQRQLACAARLVAVLSLALFSTGFRTTFPAFRLKRKDQVNEHSSLLVMRVRVESLRAAKNARRACPSRFSCTRNSCGTYDFVACTGARTASVRLAGLRGSKHGTAHA